MTVMPPGGTKLVELPDVDRRMAALAAKEHCVGSTDIRIGGDVIHRVWKCPAKHAIELYKIVGGGHTWPGEDPASAPGLGHVSSTVDATDVMLDFFSQHQTQR
jgi:polyhydroxybutyrate depolymerase